MHLSDEPKIMKKPYDEPTMIAVQYQTNLLESSPKGKFTNDAPTGGWDVGGANVKGQQSEFDTWDND